MPEYEALKSRFAGFDAQVLGVSVDNVPSNVAWGNSLGGITFDLLSDFHPRGAVASAYGVMRDDGIAERAIVIVDKRGIVRWTKLYAIPEQPDIEEAIGVLTAM